MRCREPRYTGVYGTFSKGYRECLGPHGSGSRSMVPLQDLPEAPKTAKSRVGPMIQAGASRNGAEARHRKLEWCLDYPDRMHPHTTMKYAAPLCPMGLAIRNCGHRRWVGWQRNAVNRPYGAVDQRSAIRARQTPCLPPSLFAGGHAHFGQPPTRVRRHDLNAGI